MTDEAMRVIRAAYTAETVTVYQAYAPQIADAAVRAGAFAAPFSRGRMTWIKPSFGWMMHRAQDYKRKGAIGRDWLFGHYVNCGRTLPDLAREKNISTANMARWAHLHQIRL